MENFTLPITHAMGRIAYVSPLLSTLNLVTFTYHQNDMFVTLVAGAAVKLQPVTECLAILMPFFGQVRHCTTLLLIYITCRTLPIYVYL
jgi:hypothetical protein